LQLVELSQATQVPSGSNILVDTNILFSFFIKADHRHTLVWELVRNLSDDDVNLYFNATAQAELAEKIRIFEFRKALKSVDPNQLNSNQIEYRDRILREEDRLSDRIFKDLRRDFVRNHGIDRWKIFCQGAFKFPVTQMLDSSPFQYVGFQFATPLFPEGSARPGWDSAFHWMENFGSTFGDSTIFNMAHKAQNLHALWSNDWDFAFLAKHCESPISCHTFYTQLQIQNN
jgi:hypothetical protein